jgi:hypothetical protein
MNLLNVIILTVATSSTVVCYILCLQMYKRLCHYRELYFKLTELTFCSSRSIRNVWAAVDSGNPSEVFLYSHKPTHDNGVFHDNIDEDYAYMPAAWMPFITHENSPKEVSLTIKEIRND